MTGRTPITMLMTQGEICRALGAGAKVRRKQLKLSRRALSLQSGVSVATISRFETSGVATVAVIVKLLRALGCLDGLEGLFVSSRYESIDDFVKRES